MKKSSSKELHNLLFQAVEANEKYFRDSMNISRCEFKVLLQLLTGLSHEDGGKAIGLAEATMKWHSKRIADKFNVRTRDQIIITSANIILHETFLLLENQNTQPQKG